MPEQTIILVGFMGTGKSTVAELLAERLDLRKIDLDAAIEADQGCSIPELFSGKGEAFFRQVETDVLKGTLDEGGGIVVATGGGAVLAEANRAAMLNAGLVVALTASLETILSRVQNDPNRPLLQGNAAESVPKLMESRRHAYDFAHQHIDTSDKSVEEIVELIVQRMKEK
ncbi:shikimate kinase [Paenibacillus koleovorans]|uniref:shikimate kinase n=1 Tax=Paenibacillus koleovorans TaxID=121608 RepID=UPI000FD87887|nr:shikimate kinase [Paenibacillus koleovorans]